MRRSTRLYPAELRPCPFCGNDAIVFSNETIFVMCTGCGAQTLPLGKKDFKANVNKSIQLWNRREEYESKSNRNDHKCAD